LAVRVAAYSFAVTSKALANELPPPAAA